MSFVLNWICTACKSDTGLISLDFLLYFGDQEKTSTPSSPTPKKVLTNEPGNATKFLGLLCQHLPRQASSGLGGGTAAPGRDTTPYKHEGKTQFYLDEKPLCMGSVPILGSPG